MQEDEEEDSNLVYGDLVSSSIDIVRKHFLNWWIESRTHADFCETSFE